MKYHGCRRHILNRWDIRKILSVLLLTGFFSGIIYGNLCAKEYILSLGIFNEYFLEQYSGVRLNTEEYIWYIIRIRMTTIAFLILAGCTKYKKMIVGMFIIWTGFSFGLIITMAVLKLKIQGVLLCLISVLPHFICYIAGYMILVLYYLSYPNSKWNGVKTICFISFLLLGIITECYINPVIMEIILGKL